MTPMHDATVAAISTAAGVGYLQLGGSYWTLAAAGALIGAIHWFHSYAHSDPKWGLEKSASEGLKSILFGLVVMPAAIDAAGPKLAQYSIDTPATEIAVGTLLSFVAVEIIETGTKAVKSVIKRWGGES